MIRNGMFAILAIALMTAAIPLAMALGEPGAPCVGRGNKCVSEQKLAAREFKRRPGKQCEYRADVTSVSDFNELHFLSASTLSLTSHRYLECAKLMTPANFHSHVRGCARGRVCHQQNPNEGPTHRLQGVVYGLDRRVQEVLRKALRPHALDKGKRG